MPYGYNYKNEGDNIVGTLKSQVSMKDTVEFMIEEVLFLTPDQTSGKLSINISIMPECDVKTQVMVWIVTITFPFKINSDGTAGRKFTDVFDKYSDAKQYYNEMYANLTEYEL